MNSDGTAIQEHEERHENTTQPGKEKYACEYDAQGKQQKVWCPHLPRPERAISAGKTQ